LRTISVLRLDATVFRKQFQFATARKLSAFPLALVLLFGGIGSPLISSARSVELEERAPVQSQFEELSFAHRVNPLHQLRQDAGRLPNVLAVCAQQPLGNGQNPIFNSLSGHRLPNGLLAPLTC